MSTGRAVRNAGEITSKWLEDRLHRNGFLSQGEVAGVEYGESFPSCTCEMTPIDVAYTLGSDPAAPRKLMLRHFSGDRFWHCRWEVMFYEEIVSTMANTPVVPCFDCACDEGSRLGHTLVLNIADTHAPRPGPIALLQRELLLIYSDPSFHEAPLRRFEMEEREAVVDALVRFHVHWWEHPRISQEDFIQAAGGPLCMAQAASPATIRKTSARWVEEVLPEFFHTHASELTGERLVLLERALTRWGDLFSTRVADGSGVTLIHGDAHLGQIFFSRDRESVQLYVLDWEECKRGLGPYDLAYLLVLSHAPEFRRDIERDILRYYHDRLLAAGVQSYPWQRCVEDYRLSVIACLFPPIGWGRPEFLEYALLAFEDWNCRELLAGTHGSNRS